MDNKLLGTGVVCLIAAIVGGGMKAFGLEFPLVSSIERQLMLGLLGLTLTALAINTKRKIAASSIQDVQGNPGEQKAPALAPVPTLTAGTWTLRNAIDGDDNDWSNSTIKFTTQTQTDSGLTFEGIFTWRLRGTKAGVENFRGEYFSNSRQLIFEGIAVMNDPASQSRLAVGSYSVVIAPNERKLLEGTWGSTMENEAGTAGSWEAFR